MDKAELKAAIDRLASGAIGATESSVVSERADAMDRYRGELYGDEQDGRSKITSRDIAEAVDWIMPEVMRVFFSSQTIVEFDPQGPEDVEAAEQESDYVNHVMLKQNSPFVYIHDWFKDALILKNGYVKCWYESPEKVTLEKYKGLTEDEVARLFLAYDEQGAEYEVTGQDSYQRTVVLNGMPSVIEVFDISVRVKRNYGCVRIEAVPAEEMRISKRTRASLDDTDYIEQNTVKTRSDLIEMGMEKDFVYSLPSHSSEKSTDSSARDYDDESDTHESSDRSMDEIEYRECHVKVDFNNDGVAELRKVVIVGKKIPDGPEWNEEVDYQPFCYVVPKRMPHRHIGESMYDELEDIQLIKTILERAVLDNTYGLTNAEFVVNERANLDDFLRSSPLGVKRLTGKDPVHGSIEPVNKPNILGNVLPVIDYIDRVKTERSGVKPGITGVDPDVLKEVRRDVGMENMNKANAKIEMICRMFAEIGFKPLALKVHTLLTRYQDKPKVTRLRNKWVTINPMEWKDRSDMTVTVGLGNGNRTETMTTMKLIAEAQSALLSMGLVGPKQAYNAFIDMVKALGKPNPESYVINPDPNNPEYQEVLKSQQQPNPLAEVEQIKQQSQQQIAQMKEQGERERAQLKAQIEHGKQMLTLQKQEAESVEAGLRLELDKREQFYKEITDSTKQKADLTVLAERAKTEQDLLDLKSAIAKKMLEAETAELVAEREKLKLEIIAAQNEFEKRVIQSQQQSQKEVNKNINLLNQAIFDEMRRTVEILSRPRKTRISKKDDDGMPLETVSEVG